MVQDGECFPDAGGEEARRESQYAPTLADAVAESVEGERGVLGAGGAAGSSTSAISAGTPNWRATPVQDRRS